MNTKMCQGCEDAPLGQHIGPHDWDAPEMCACGHNWKQHDKGPAPPEGAVPPRLPRLLLYQAGADGNRCHSVCDLVAPWRHGRSRTFGGMGMTNRVAPYPCPFVTCTWTVPVRTVMEGREALREHVREEHVGWTPIESDGGAVAWREP